LVIFLTQFIMRFKCRKSEVQEYGCQVCKKTFFSKDRLICFDKCLTDELFYLWDMGIITTGCCCGGHKGVDREMAYIGVEFKFITKMKELGYKVRFNPMRLKDEDSFIPKTLI